MRHLYAFLLAFLVGIHAAYAVRIHGTVITGDDNKPAPGTAIRAFDKSDKMLAGGTTDPDGKFDFNIPDNTDHVEIHLIGQQDQNLKPSELNGQTIVLAMVATTLPETVITYNRTTGGGDGCDKETNDRIAPELALCSVHAYNIGVSTNPSGADKQLMKEIVALKTTVITQQMNKQYEYMDAMIRRFKTQLEKAVLTTKIQVAGGTTGETTESGSTGSRYSGGVSGVRSSNGLSNAEDCLNTTTTPLDAMQCLLRNVPKIQGAVSSGDLNSARRQLDSDLDVLSSYRRWQDIDACTEIISNPRGGKCEGISKTSGNRNNITTCVGTFRACIINNIEAIQNGNKDK